MTQIVISDNSRQELFDILSEYSTENIFLVHGKGSYIKSGAYDFISQLFEKDTLTSFSNFDVNPNIEDLRKGVELFNKRNYKLIIAIGGGSVLDMAKLIGVMASQYNDIEGIINGDIAFDSKNIDLLAIPTTAGTGAEATHFAVVYINKVKYSVAHNAILPKYVYLSSEFTMSANKEVTATTGADALAQAMESQWSINATAESEAYSLKAFELIWKNLDAAVNDNNCEAKRKMMEASFLAGKAINITKTTAPHAISYSFTSYYGIAHGHAVVLSLPFFLKYNIGVTNQDCTLENGVSIIKSRIGKLLNIMHADENSAHGILSDFISEIGLEINLSDLIADLDKELIMHNINLERLNNNPRKVNHNTIKRFLNKDN
ncbi:MAG: phosphonoacetaldehyde reductase [Bacteroidales bacterium]|nr:phosphonoacetaldehyde reductase [Bacteroidales bacterium]